MSDIKEIAKQVDSIKSTIGGLQNQIPLQSSPLNYFYASDKEYKLYKKKVQDFTSTAQNLPNDHLEELILFINKGARSYIDLKKQFHYITDATLQLYLLDTPKWEVEPPLYSSDSLYSPFKSKNYAQCYFELVTVPNNFYAPYYFTDSDEIQLTILGLNTLQRLEKENHTLQLAEESLRISKKSAKYGKFAALLAGIGILTTIVIAILTFILS
jgi:hypothetical protein